MCIRDRLFATEFFQPFVDQLPNRATNKYRNTDLTPALRNARTITIAIANVNGGHDTMNPRALPWHASPGVQGLRRNGGPNETPMCGLSLIHISEPTRLLSISYAVFCLKKKKK